jgi:CheY-like chemotaxis protein
MTQAMTDLGDILVVDDEASVVEVVALYLRREGFSVRLARDGREALAAVREQLPALVVLDVMLPQVDGLEIVRRLRQDPTSNVPIILLTARSQETDRIYGLELGADDYVTKALLSGRAGVAGEGGAATHNDRSGTGRTAVNLWPAAYRSPFTPGHCQ